MQVKFSTIPVGDPFAAEEEANRFLRAHRVLSVEKHFVDKGEGAFWALAVNYVDGHGRGGSRRGKGKRIDYMEVLPPEQFAVFAKLRELRREVAAEEGVPPFVIFTDEHLAAMVTGHADSLAKLRGIQGIGEAKAEKYGERFLGLLAAAGQEDAEKET